MVVFITPTPTPLPITWVQLPTAPTFLLRDHEPHTHTYTTPTYAHTYHHHTPDAYGMTTRAVARATPTLPRCRCRPVPAFTRYGCTLPRSHAFTPHTLRDTPARTHHATHMPACL